MNETIAKINKISWFFEKIKNCQTISQTHQVKKKEKSQINKIRNEQGEVTIDNTEIKRIVRDYYEQYMAIK